MGYCGIIGYSIYNQDYDKELVMHLWGCYSSFLPCISNKLAQKKLGKRKIGGAPQPAVSLSQDTSAEWRVSPKLPLFGYALSGAS